MWTRTCFGKVYLAPFLAAGVAALAVKPAAAQPLNACCLPNGACQDSLRPATCEGLGGMSFWPCSTCEEVGCPHPSCIGATGSCGSAHATAGCENAWCCEIVCNQDPSCCEQEWDADCAFLAEMTCMTPSVIVECCLPDGSCVELSNPATCAKAGGTGTSAIGELCRGDSDGDGVDDGCPCEQAEPSPAVSEWGLLMLTLLLLTGIQIKFGRRAGRGA